MADDSDRTPQEIVREAAWQYTSYAMILALAVGAGVFVGNQLWGDAPGLRKRVDQLGKQVIRLKNERTDLEGKVAVIEPRLQKCEADVQAAREAVAAAEAAAVATDEEGEAEG